VGAVYFPVPGPGHPAAILTGVSGPVNGQQFSVEKEIFHIGASLENDLPIAADDYVSASHAYLRYEKGSLFIFDNGSRNSTFVNEHEVTETGCVLGSGDHIRVGMSTFEVVIVPS
jgi:predicted component of type VI protein secretion system